PTFVPSVSGPRQTLAGRRRPVSAQQARQRAPVRGRQLVQRNSEAAGDLQRKTARRPDLLGRHAVLGAQRRELGLPAGGRPPRWPCVTGAHSEPPNSPAVVPSRTIAAPGWPKPMDSRRRTSPCTPSTPIDP